MNEASVELGNTAFTRLERIVLYETANLVYLVGFDADESQFRVLKLDRSISKPSSLSEILTVDQTIYDKEGFKNMLNVANEGQKSTGGVKKVLSGYGLVGFVKFLDCYYINLITQRKKVGCISGNFVYTIRSTEVYPIRPKGDEEGNLMEKLWKKLNKKWTQTKTDSLENNYLRLFQFMDLSNDFFYSYTYDLTNSFQRNYIVGRNTVMEETKASMTAREAGHALGGQAKASTSGGEIDSSSSNRNLQPPPVQDAFEWNNYLTEELRSILGALRDYWFWVQPIIQGSYRQRKFTFFGKELDMMLIARRSRHYAGTRYLKRGISVHGKVANDCETEQIVCLDRGLQSSFASHVQVRGSIPVYWAQETSVTMPKPPIIINRVDTTYAATQEHFADLLMRYNTPVIVLDLTKQVEKTKRETLVGLQYRQAVLTLNASMPLKHQIRYCALDYDFFKKYKPPKRTQDGGATAGLADINRLGERLRMNTGAEAALGTLDTASSAKGVSAVTSASGGGGGGHNGGSLDVGEGTPNGRDIALTISAAASSTYSLTSGETLTTSYIDSVASRIRRRPTIRRPSSVMAGGTGALIAESSDDEDDDDDNDYSFPVHTAIGSGISYFFQDDEAGGNSKIVSLDTGGEGEGVGAPSGVQQHGGGQAGISTANAATKAVAGQTAQKRAFTEPVLDEITDMAISETGIFCSHTDYLAKVALFRDEHASTSSRRGFMMQQGVLRTNCIDCIDRTNAAQTFMGMKMLNVALQALGLRRSEERPLSQDHPLMAGLIEMYMELGNRVSLQYGGSEAHLKFDGYQNSNNAVLELNTSLKRYYNNSFEDQSKQHAINVFLGRFIPSQHETPLWEAQDDYELHNRSFHPAETLVDRVVLKKIFADIHRLRSAPIHVTGARLATNESRGISGEDQIPGVVFIDGHPQHQQQQQQQHRRKKSQGEGDGRTSTFSFDDNEEEPDNLPAVDISRAIRTYFVRALDPRVSGASAWGSPVSDTSHSHAARRALERASASSDDSEPRESTYQAAAGEYRGRSVVLRLSGSGETVTMPLSALKSLIWSERRKYISKAASSRMRQAVEMWWRAAIKDHCIYNRALAAPSSSTYQWPSALTPPPPSSSSTLSPITLPPPPAGSPAVVSFAPVPEGTGVPKSPVMPSSGRRRSSLGLQREVMKWNRIRRESFQVYFHRVHKPARVTDFDETLTQSFADPTNAAAQQRDVAAEQEDEDERRALLEVVATKYNIAGLKGGATGTASATSEEEGPRRDEGGCEDKDKDQDQDKDQDKDRNENDGENETAAPQERKSTGSTDGSVEPSFHTARASASISGPQEPLSEQDNLDLLLRSVADVSGRLGSTGFFDVDSEDESDDDQGDDHDMGNGGSEVSDSDESDVVDWDSMYSNALAGRKASRYQGSRKASITRPRSTLPTGSKRSADAATIRRNRRRQQKFADSGIGLPVDRSNARVYRDHAHIAKNHTYMLGHIALGLPAPEQKHEMEKARTTRRVCTPEELATHSSITDAFTTPQFEQEEVPLTPSQSSETLRRLGLGDRQLSSAVPVNSYYHRVLAQENSAYSEYASYLQESTIDVNDVKAMQDLQSDHHVHLTLQVGVYTGMPQQQSAVDTEVFMSRTFNTVETPLLLRAHAATAAAALNDSDSTTSATEGLGDYSCSGIGNGLFYNADLSREYHDAAVLEMHGVSEVTASPETGDITLWPRSSHTDAGSGGGGGVGRGRTGTAGVATALDQYLNYGPSSAASVPAMPSTASASASASQVPEEGGGWHRGSPSPAGTTADASFPSIRGSSPTSTPADLNEMSVYNRLRRLSTLGRIRLHSKGEDSPRGAAEGPHGLSALSEPIGITGNPGSGVRGGGSGFSPLTIPGSLSAGVGSAFSGSRAATPPAFVASSFASLATADDYDPWRDNEGFTSHDSFHTASAAHPASAEGGEASRASPAPMLTSGSEPPSSAEQPPRRSTYSADSLLDMAFPVPAGVKHTSTSAHPPSADKDKDKDKDKEDRGYLYRPPREKESRNATPASLPEQSIGNDLGVGDLSLRGASGPSISQILQSLQAYCVAQRAASGLQRELVTRAKMFVARYGSYSRYLSYRRCSARLSFLCDDEAYDMYTCSPAFYGHIRTFIDVLTPEFDDISFIAVDASRQDVVTRRARWKGASFLKSALLLAPYRRERSKDHKARRDAAAGAGAQSPHDSRGSSALIRARSRTASSTDTLNTLGGGGGGGSGRSTPAFLSLSRSASPAQGLSPGSPAEEASLADSGADSDRDSYYDDVMNAPELTSPGEWGGGGAAAASSSGSSGGGGSGSRGGASGGVGVGGVGGPGVRSDSPVAPPPLGGRARTRSVSSKISGVLFGGASSVPRGGGGGGRGESLKTPARDATGTGAGAGGGTGSAKDVQYNGFKMLEPDLFESGSTHIIFNEVAVRCFLRAAHKRSRRNQTKSVLAGQWVGLHPSPELPAILAGGGEDRNDD